MIAARAQVLGTGCWLQPRSAWRALAFRTGQRTMCDDVVLAAAGYPGGLPEKLGSSGGLDGNRADQQQVLVFLGQALMPCATEDCSGGGRVLNVPSADTLAQAAGRRPCMGEPLQIGPRGFCRRDNRLGRAHGVMRRFACSFRRD